jgi:hypothetical protein
VGCGSDSDVATNQFGRVEGHNLTSWGQESLAEGSTVVVYLGPYSASCCSTFSGAVANIENGHLSDGIERVVFIYSWVRDEDREALEREMAGFNYSVIEPELIPMSAGPLWPMKQFKFHSNDLVAFVPGPNATQWETVK